MTLRVAPDFPATPSPAAKYASGLHTGRLVTFGTVHNTLIRLEEKGFVVSSLGGATAEWAGRRKRLFTVTAAGSRALQDIRQLRNQLRRLLPPHALKLSGQ